MLSQMADITNHGQWYSIEIHDVVEDNGPVVQRIFHMLLSKKKDALTLQIKLDTSQKM
jgi:hypothetical protein